MTLLASASPSDQVELTKSVSFSTFDERAKAGESLTVVFFGGSLTWGANASDPMLTSYRGLMMQYLTEKYPKAHLSFHDAAIGGTGSMLGLFRLQRDVLRHQPDLVFLDFTMNDGPTEADSQTTAAYEVLLRNLLQRGTLVQPVITTFRFFVDSPEEPKLPRVEQHLQLAEAYGLPAANIHQAIRSDVQAGKVKPLELWPFDGAHPDDPGYAFFFQVIKEQFERNIANRIVAKIPETTMIEHRYPKVERQRLVDAQLPKGWHQAKTRRTSLWFDGLASRWMGDVVSARMEGEAPEALEVAFEGSMVGLFGERDSVSVPFRAWVDGVPLADPNVKEGDAFIWKTDSSRFSPAKSGSGNLFLWVLLSKDLTDGKHVLRIEPIFAGADPKADLRIESICSAGR